jgi:hypothetical protein
MCIYGRGSSRFLLGASAVGVIPQHSTIQYRTCFAQHLLHTRGIFFTGFFYCDRVDSQGNLYGVFLVFWRGRGGWGYVYMNIWRLIDIIFEVEGLGNLM